MALRPPLDVGAPPSDEELARRLQAEDTRRVAAAVVPRRRVPSQLQLPGLLCSSLPAQQLTLLGTKKNWDKKSGPTNFGANLFQGKAMDANTEANHL